MQKILPSLLSLLLLLMVACQSPAQQVKLLNADEFEKALQSGQVQLLDCRTSDEYKSGHLKGALQADWLQRSQFEERTRHLDPSKPVYVYCLSGGRSGQAAEFLLTKGFKELYNLQGGIQNWKQKKKPLEGQAPVAQMSPEDYVSLSKSAPLVLVDFGAEWCPPCRKMEPVLAELTKKYPDRFKLVKVDGGVHTRVMEQYGVEALPTFIVYREGREVWRKLGIVELTEFVSALGL